VKLWIAVAFFAVGTPAMRRLLTRTDLIRRLGTPVFLPNSFGWALAVRCRRFADDRLVFVRGVEPRKETSGCAQVVIML
jgi:hypothetical protein